MPGEINRMMALPNWNGNQLCAIDVETSGLDPSKHDIIQIALLPLDASLKPRKDVLPYYLYLIPRNPEAVDLRALKVNRLTLNKLYAKGVDPDKAIVLLMEWVSKLKLAPGKRLIPLGHNYGFDSLFLIRWLGLELYTELIHHIYRDTLTIAAYINDCRNVHLRKGWNKSLRLIDLCLHYGLEPFKAHNALYDCQLVAELYHRIVMGAMFPLSDEPKRGGRSRKPA